MKHVKPSHWNESHKNVFTHDIFYSNKKHDKQKIVLSSGIFHHFAHISGTSKDAASAWSTLSVANAAQAIEMNTNGGLQNCFATFHVMTQLLPFALCGFRLIIFKQLPQLSIVPPQDIQIDCLVNTSKADSIKHCTIWLQSCLLCQEIKVQPHTFSQHVTGTTWQVIAYQKSMFDWLAD